MPVASSVVAKYPMPRARNTFQIALREPPPVAWSASRIALRSSRNDGSGGESRMASVISWRAFAEPTAVRRSHSVSAQISPSECTS